MESADKRQDLINILQTAHMDLGKIDNVLDHVEILCDKCKIKSKCVFIYHVSAVAFKDIPLKTGQTENDFTKWECMFLVKNPDFKHLVYTGKKKK